MKAPNLTRIEDSLWILNTHIGLGVYDFDFERYFSCHHPVWWEGTIQAIARMGAAPDYAQRYNDLLQFNVELIHTPEQYERSSKLPVWYPILEGLTPRSVWFDTFPTPEAIEAHFDYPIFIKGERQTNKHSRHQSIIESPQHLREVLQIWHNEPILRWQRVVCRHFERLRQVAPDLGGGLPVSFEFRSFWWHGRCVGIGPYWTSPRYSLNDAERRDALNLGRQAAGRLDLPFVVIDLAQTIDGRWIVIECNDAQDSGYAGVPRHLMWRHILDGTEV
mgnify:CR=1 FL=1